MGHEEPKEALLVVARQTGAVEQEVPVQVPSKERLVRMEPLLTMIVHLHCPPLGASFLPIILLLLQAVVLILEKVVTVGQMHLAICIMELVRFGTCRVTIIRIKKRHR